MSLKRSNLTFFVKNDCFWQKWSLLTKNVKFDHFRDTVPIQRYIFSFSTLWDGRFKLSTTILPSFWNFDFIWHFSIFQTRSPLWVLIWMTFFCSNLISRTITHKKNLGSKKKSQNWSNHYSLISTFPAPTAMHAYTSAVK